MTTGQGHNWPGPAPAAQPGPVQQPGAAPPGAVQHDPAQHGWGQHAPVQQQGQPPAGPWPGAPGAAAASAQQHPGVGAGWSGPQAPGVSAQRLPGAGPVSPSWSGPGVQGPPAQQLPGAAVAGWSGPQAPGAAGVQQLPGPGAGTAVAGRPGPQAPGGVAHLPGVGTVTATSSGPQAQEAPAQAGPPPGAGLPGPASGGPYAAASRRISFPTLVLVELRKLTGTLSDRILLALAPVVLIGVTVLIHTATDYASTYASAQGQISPTFYTVRVGHVLLHAVLIKLIAGEWQHRSAQPTLLVQPSRARYFLAQATVVLMLWVLAAVLQLVTTLLVAPAAISGVGAGYLLGYRTGWVVGVCVLGSLLTILVALTVAMLVPNAAGALAIYFATVPVMLTISGLAPEVFAWVDPSSATAALATVALVEGPGPVIVSLVLWAGLLALAGFRVARRDLA